MSGIIQLPLYEKLGIENGFQIKLINEPDNFIDSLNGILEKIHLHKKLLEPVDLIHLFTRSRKELLVEFPVLKKYVKENGAFWVSWPKKSSAQMSDLDYFAVREIGLINGLTDVSGCSIDDNWNALKFCLKNEGK
ncbi:MAG: DUF3052 domain-containing protein [Ignavibacteriae bacterium HGW-Ignavibacteriae-3]|nr:MAG: DUF3052 domain-containing protein [Ignavibacteriae bacterium HGW-Ignavibacteriae-3]